MKRVLIVFIIYFIFTNFTVAQNENWPSKDTPIVIVHGAWGGAHDWRAVENKLNKNGYEVRRVSLTGQGERSHLISYLNDFSTHVKDVVNMIHFEYDEDEKIYLVGHSYGGNVITGVSSQIPEKIQGLVYVDASITTPEMMNEKKYLEKFGFKGEISPNNFLIAPFWPIYEEDPAGYKDVPHQAKTLLFPKTVFFKYEEASRIPGSFILLAGTDWEDGTEFKPSQGYKEAEKRGYYLTVKPWEHNAPRDRPEEFYPVLLHTLGKVK